MPAVHCQFEMRGTSAQHKYQWHVRLGSFRTATCIHIYVPSPHTQDDCIRMVRAAGRTASKHHLRPSTAAAVAATQHARHSLLLPSYTVAWQQQLVQRMLGHTRSMQRATCATGQMHCGMHPLPPGSVCGCLQSAGQQEPVACNIRASIDRRLP